MKRAITNPTILSKVAEIVSRKIDSHGIDRIAGPVVGSIPL